MKNKHGSEPKYKCKQCEFVAEYVADTWEHTLEAHPEESDQESDKENIILKIVAEQTNALMGEVASIKKDTRDVFKEIADMFTLAIDKIKRDNDLRYKTLGKTVEKIYEKVSKLAEDQHQSRIKTPEVSKKETFADIVNKD